MVREQAWGGDDPAHNPLWIKVAAGSMSGVIGSAIANPTDVVMIRMQAPLVGTTIAGNKPVFNWDDICLIPLGYIY